MSDIRFGTKFECMGTNQMEILKVCCNTPYSTVGDFNRHNLGTYVGDTMKMILTEKPHKKECLHITSNWY